MCSYQTVDLGTPYHDPTSPLYHQSLRASRTSTTTMTQSSQLSSGGADYFTHHPRSFLSAHTDFDEKLSSPSTPPQRGRAPTRLLGYEQPIFQVVPNDRPRVPRTRTLVRFLLLCTLALLCTLGWRCESVGCSGRGGGGLVGGDYVGGGSVTQGVDLSRIWDKESWGGERQDGSQGEGSSTLDAFRHIDEEGELVEMEGVEGDNEEEGTGEVGWDESMDADEGEGGGSESGDESKEGEDEEEPEAQTTSQDEGATVAEEKPEESHGAYESTSDEAVGGPVGEMTGPGKGGVEAVAADADAGVQGIAQDAMPVAQEGRKVGQKLRSWLGSMDGLW